MASENSVRELLEAILDSGLSAEEVCRDAPELLPRVRERLRRTARSRPRVDRLFPPASPTALSGGLRLTGRLPPTRLRGAGRAGPRRHGCRVPGVGSPPQPPRRPEDAPGRRLRPPG